MNATQYVAALRRGLKDAVGVIEALDGMTRQSREFETEVLQPLRDVLKLKLSPCPVCSKRRKLTSHCPQHEYDGAMYAKAMPGRTMRKRRTDAPRPYRLLASYPRQGLNWRPLDSSRRHAGSCHAGAPNHRTKNMREDIVTAIRRPDTSPRKAEAPGKAARGQAEGRD